MSNVVSFLYRQQISYNYGVHGVDAPVVGVLCACAYNTGVGCLCVWGGCVACVFLYTGGCGCVGVWVFVLKCLVRVRSVNVCEYWPI